MKNFEDYLKEQLKSKRFRREWNASQSQFDLVRQLIQLRIEEKISQRELASKAKTTQAVISRIESGQVSPSLKLIERLASALDRKLVIGLK